MLSDEEKQAIKEIKSFNQYNWELNNLKTKKFAKPYFDSLDTILNLIQKQDKIIDKMAEHLADIIENDDNASLLPFKDSEDNLQEKIIEYFKKEVEKDVKD